MLLLMIWFHYTKIKKNRENSRLIARLLFMIIFLKFLLWYKNNCLITDWYLAFEDIHKKIIICILNHLITNHYVDSWTLFVKKFDWLYNKKQSRALWCLDFSKFFRLYKFYRFSFLNLICVQSIEFHTWWFYT